MPHDYNCCLIDNGSLLVINNRNFPANDARLMKPDGLQSINNIIQLQLAIVWIDLLL